MSGEGSLNDGKCRGERYLVVDRIHKVFEKEHFSDQQEKTESRSEKSTALPEGKKMTRRKRR